MINCGLKRETRVGKHKARPQPIAARRASVSSEMFEQEPILTAEYNRAFDLMRQFVNVARPRVCEQARLPFGRDRTRREAVAAAHANQQFLRQENDVVATLAEG